MPTHPNFRDLTGQTFGKLLVVAYAGQNPKRKGSLWHCRCDCGVKRTTSTSDLTSGNTKSCGCLHGEVLIERNTKHGHSTREATTPEYRAWQHMIQRCYSRSYRFFHRYGGRGIRVCDRWRNSFEAFFADVGSRPGKNFEIDRIDNDGDYEPGNVRWVTKVRNCRNRSTNRLITFNGERLCIADWSDRTGIPAQVIRERINEGWSAKDALTKPKKRRANAGRRTQ